MTHPAVDACAVLAQKYIERLAEASAEIQEIDKQRKSELKAALKLMVTAIETGVKGSAKVMKRLATAHESWVKQVEREEPAEGDLFVSWDPISALNDESLVENYQIETFREAINDALENDNSAPADCKQALAALKESVTEWLKEIEEQYQEDEEEEENEDEEEEAYLVCDRCDKHSETEDSLEEAVESAKAAGWQVRRGGRDLCPDCQV